MSIQLLAAEKVSGVDTITTIYTAPSGGPDTIINALSVTNNSEASATYKAYIYDSVGVTAGAVSPQKIVVKDRFDSSPAIVNQAIKAGGTLRVENSTADALVFHLTGVEQ